MRSFLLIGLGRFGQHIAEKLNEFDYDIMAIDKNEERVGHVSQYISNAMIGDSTNIDFMRSLGVQNFDVCIVAIGDDFKSSLQTTSLLDDLNAKFIVSRAASDQHEKILRKNGAHEVVYPEKQLAAWTAITYSSKQIFDYIELNGEFSFFEIAVPQKWIGKTVVELDIRKKYQINIVGLKSGDRINPSISPDTVLTSDVTMLVIGTDAAVQKCFHLN